MTGQKWFLVNKTVLTCTSLSHATDQKAFDILQSRSNKWFNLLCAASSREDPPIALTDYQRRLSLCVKVQEQHNLKLLSYTGHSRASPCMSLEGSWWISSRGCDRGWRLLGIYRRNYTNTTMRSTKQIASGRHGVMSISLHRFLGRSWNIVATELLVGKYMPKFLTSDWQCIYSSGRWI